MTIGRIPSVEGGIQPTIVDAKGDLIAATAADTVARLAVGANNTVLTADSSTATGLKWATPAAGGKVLQVVSADYSTSTTVASTSSTDTGLTATITPTSSTSKILIIITQGIVLLRDTNQPINCLYEVFRGATSIAGVTELFGFQMGTDSSGRAALRIPFAYTKLDSPATTSAITYKTKGAASTTSNNGQVIFQRNDTTSTITLMEIGA
jgi:hypothetical protein